MKSQRAQVTLFVILGIVIVGAVAYFTAIKPALENFGLSDEAKLVKATIQSCLDADGKDAIEVVSLQGGYAQLPDSYTRESILEIGNWYENGNDVSPSLTDIGSEISLFVDVLMEYCANFSQLNAEITTEQPETSAIIKDKEIVLTTIYPIKIVQDNKTYNLKQFIAKFPVTLKKSYTIAREIVDVQQKDKTCLTCLSDIGSKYDVFIESAKNNLSYVYTITDENQELLKPYKFKFAVKLE